MFEACSLCIAGIHFSPAGVLLVCNVAVAGVRSFYLRQRTFQISGAGVACLHLCGNCAYSPTDSF